MIFCSSMSISVWVILEGLKNESSLSSSAWKSLQLYYSARFTWLLWIGCEREPGAIFTSSSIRLSRRLDFDIALVLVGKEVTAFLFACSSFSFTEFWAFKNYTFFLCYSILFIFLTMPGIALRYGCTSLFGITGIATLTPLKESIASWLI